MTDHERKVLEKYLEADGEKDPLIRSLARYTRASLGDLRRDLDMLERFNRTYAKEGRG